MAGIGLRRSALALAAAAGVLLATAGPAGPAAAHAQLVGSDPSDGVNLPAPPAHVTINLSESVELRYTHVTVTAGDGRVMAVGGVHLASRPGLLITRPDRPARVPTTLVADLPPLPPDLYRVAWSTISSDDLHATSGVLVFGVLRNVAAHSPAPDPAPPLTEVVLRWLALLGIGLAAGSGLLLLLLGRTLPGGNPATARRRLLLAAAGGAGMAAALGVVLLDVQAHAGGEGWLVPAWRVLTSGGYGLRWLLRESAALALVAIPVALLRRTGDPGREDRIVTAGVIPLLVYAAATALTGHSGSGAAAHPARVLAETVHVSAALLWAGTLLATITVLAGRRTGSASLLRPVLARFGLIAVACLALMTITGLVLAGASLASVDAMLYSTYGRLLLVKLGLAVLALAAAAGSALALHPGRVQWQSRRGVRRPGPSAPVRTVLARTVLARTLLVETVLAAAVVALAASLAASQPATGPGWSADTFAKPILTSTPADLVETVQVAPNRPGRNFVTVDVFDTRRPAPAPIRAVVLTLRGENGQRLTLPATPQGGGRWLLTTDALTTSGRWDVTVDVQRPGLQPVTATYPWSVADPGARLDRTVVSSRPLAPILDRVATALAITCLVTLAVVVRRRRRRGGTASAPAGRARAGDGVPAMADSGTAAMAGAGATSITGCSTSVQGGAMSSEPAGYRSSIGCP